MTIPSFQPIQNQQMAIQKGPLVLKQGQVFYGSVKQLYPNQTAEIQIGEHRLVAKLETPLKVGDSHFFQVTGINPQAELKVVSGPMVKESANVQQLMESLNLPKSQEMQQLLTHFIKNQLPISREQLMQAESWLKSLPDGASKQEALSALQKLVELKLPFTEETFKALLFGSKTSGITNNLEQFAQLLDRSSNVNPQAKENLLNAIRSIAKPLETETAGLVIARSVRTLLDGAAQSTIKQNALNILKEANILPKEANLSNWLNQLTVSSKNDTAGSMIGRLQSGTEETVAQRIQQIAGWVENEHNLTAQQKNAILQTLKSFNGTNGEQLGKQLHAQLLEAYSEQTVNGLFAKGDGISPKEQLLSLLKHEFASNPEAELKNLARTFRISNEPATNALFAESEELLLSKLNGKGMQQAIQSILKNLGLSYESALNKTGDVESIVQSLKPQVLSFIRDESVPAELKNAAEMLLARLNGMQLLSGEAGHQHQIIMQIPLQFLGKQVDATVQWNGRMKKDGKIDSNYARILFYLNMEALKETVIDMQVQNRIVTVYVYNEHEGLEPLAEPLKKSLKAGLEEKNYHLSGVMIKPFSKRENVTKKVEKTGDNGASHKGVDIRI